MCELELTNGQIALLDDEDFERFKHLRINVRGPIENRYAIVKTERIGRQQKYVCLHRLIVNAGPGQFVDHINRNTLDNRKCNLRVCTHKQNLCNRLAALRVGFKGVVVHQGKYRATIQPNGKDVQLGMFRSAEEAARAYDEAARHYYGEFARLNFPRTGEQSALRKAVQS